MFHRFSAVILLGTLSAGCGSDQPNRAPLRGTVSYEGKPVAYGTISLRPDRAKGNKGAFGAAEIKEGVYQTNPGYGVSLGPMLATFTIFDAMPPSNTMLANIQDLAVDIPSGTTEWNFELTARKIKELPP